MIRSSAAAIKQFASSIRVLAQNRLLEAAAEKNQAAMANYLQVFYNLDSLPEIVMMAIDQNVKLTLESARDVLDLTHLASLHTDYTNKITGALPVASLSTKSNASTTAGSGSAAPSASGGVTIVQLRIAIRELAHAWSSVIYDRATQVMVFQRVVQKKEDPASHEKFLDVLKRSKAAGPGAGAFLQSGQLLQLFWLRLSAGLMDVCHEKLKSHASIAARVYPYLRRAAIDVVDNVNAWNNNDKQSEHNSASQFMMALQVVGMKERNQLAIDADLFAQSEAVGGMFGSLLWGQFDLLGGVPKGYLSSPTDSEAWASSAVKSKSAAGADHELLEGLRPLKDRYLAYSLERMNMPILQMFPEVEGYTAAVPSRRDLQTLTKAIQSELTTAVIESDIGLVGAICKELVKVVKLMLSKIETMVANSADTRKISLQNNFARTHAQEQNGQLFMLLMQFREILENIPAQAMKSANEGAGSGSDAKAIAQSDALLVDIQHHIDVATAAVDDLAYQIIEGVVSLLAGYAESILLGIHKEGVVQLPVAGKAAMFSGMDSSTDCSLAVQTLTKQLPNMLKSHLLSLNKSPLLDVGLEELALRIAQSYVSIAALTRPVSEQSRLRTAADMAAIEMSLAAFCNMSSIQNCPIVSEYKAFRRLLFQDLTKGKTKAKDTTHMAVPERSVLLSLDFVDDLRPSTLLGYLICCGPTQLPLPHEALNKDISFYIDGLLECSEAMSPATYHQRYVSQVLVSLRALYHSKTNAWKKVRNEKRNWEDVQQSLDVFFQRIAVAEGEQKALMRNWYEAIIDIGSHYFR